MTTPKPSRPLSLAALLTFALAVGWAVVVVAHDGGHGSDALPPYDGEGYSAGAGGEPGMLFPSSNIHLLSWIPVVEFGDHDAANDCWGYVSPSGREYAIIGLSGGTGFVEITNPGQPQIVAVIPGPGSVWRDIKVYGHHAYAVTEGNNPAQAIQVIDLSQIDNGIVVHTNTVNDGGSVTTTRTHNVAIDEVSGYLYRTGGSSGSIGLRIYSLADPANPTFVGEWHDRYVHDAEVVTYTEGPYAGKQIAFLYSNNGSGGGNPGLDILDVTDKSNIVQLGFTTYSWPAFSHQGWLNDDRTLVYLNDELAETTYGIPTTTRVIDVSDLTNPFEASTFTNGNSAIGHNIYMRGDLLFASNYRSGLRLFDTSVDPLNPVEIGYFDTFPQNDNPNFNGVWSNYPFFPSGVVIGSDIEKGLFVWWIGDLPFSFSYPDGLPEMIDPSGDTVRVQISAIEGQQVLPGSAKLHLNLDGMESTIDLVDLGGDLYDAVFPATACGSLVQWYVSAQNISGLTLRDPPTAPATTHIAIAGSDVETVFTDNFDDDLGWTVGAPDDNATAGHWVRADPVGTSSGGQQVQPDAPFIGSACYITGQHPGGGAGANDVDNGKTTLFSPVFDFSDADEVIISYWRWYSNHAGANPHNDIFEVDITSDPNAIGGGGHSGGGSAWINVETVGPSGPETMGGWYRHEFAVSQFVELTDTVQVRFIASDYNPQALIEAAVDAFNVQYVDCIASCLGDIAGGGSGGDGVVDVSDLLALLSAWGACPENKACGADLNSDGIVDVSDLLLLLGAWGTCR